MQTLKKPKFGVIASIMETSGLRFFVALPKATIATSCEIRLDSLWGKLDLILKELASMIIQPTILTLRSEEQGGGMHISLSDQWNFWENLPENLSGLIRNPNSNVYVDWDLDLIGYALHRRRQLPFPWEKIGASAHVFTETPDDLPNLLADLETTPAKAFLKLVTVARSDDDLVRLRSLFHGRTDSRPLISFGMGEIGKQSRFECLGYGSAGTYGFIPGHQKAAPGQVSISELLNDERVRKVLITR